MSIFDFFMQNWIVVVVSAVIAYLLGSVNTAVIVTRVVTKGKQDIREMGSGNAGFTNVLRSVGKVPAVFTIVCDALKSIISVMIGGLLFSIAANGMENPVSIIRAGCYMSGAFCILGHSFPLYFRFKGGKGIVTAAGMMLVADWRVFLLILATFLIIFICSKIISLASIICAIMFPVYTFLMCSCIASLIFGYSLRYALVCTLFAFMICVFVVIRHSANIKRLLKGEEKKITAKK